MSSLSALSLSGDRNSYQEVLVSNFLNKRELIFIKELLDGETQTGAARRAGYPHPDVAGSRLVRKPLVLAEINKRKELLVRERAFMSRNDYIKELYKQYLSETSAETRRKYFEMLGNILGFNATNKGGTPMLAIFQSLQLKDDVKKRLEVEELPGEIEKQIDDSTQKLDFKQPEFARVRDNWRKRGYELDEKGDLYKIESEAKKEA